MRRIACAVGSLALLLSLAACGAPNPHFDPAKALRDSGRAMEGVNTLTADASFGGGSQVYGFTLQSAHAVFRRPSDTDTMVKARRGDTLVDFELISLDSKEYLKLPVIGWQDVSGSGSELPDIARLMDNRLGLPAVLPDALSPSEAGRESIDGHDCLVVHAGFTAEQVGQVVTVLQPQGVVSATIWVDASNSLLRKIRLDGPLYATTTSFLEVHLRDFGGSVNITKPAI
jgi:hypothetical protein